MIHELLHVLGVVDDDVALLLGSVDPAHHDHPIILILSCRPAHEDGFRGEESVGEFLLDCLSRVYIHLVVESICWSAISWFHLHHRSVCLEDIVGEVAKPWKSADVV